MPGRSRTRLAFPFSLAHWNRTVPRQSTLSNIPLSTLWLIPPSRRRDGSLSRLSSPRKAMTDDKKAKMSLFDHDLKVGKRRLRHLSHIKVHASINDSWEGYMYFKSANASRLGRPLRTVSKLQPCRLLSPTSWTLAPTERPINLLPPFLLAAPYPSLERASSLTFAFARI
ncbi:hypothetical protein GGR57DRAFT_372129 [Xylariaceae sp. FL1272]|nr:hypothetical protein GGR57DRAFT_372129 [Xylariaceae sp. FL1272]